MYLLRAKRSHLDTNSWHINLTAFARATLLGLVKTSCAWLTLYFARKVVSGSLELERCLRCRYSVSSGTKKPQETAPRETQNARTKRIATTHFTLDCRNYWNEETTDFRGNRKLDALPNPLLTTDAASSTKNAGDYLRVEITSNLRGVTSTSTCSWRPLIRASKSSNQGY